MLPEAIEVVSANIACSTCYALCRYQWFKNRGHPRSTSRLSSPDQFVRSVAEISPIDLRDPTLLNVVILNEAFDQHFVWLTVIVRIIGVERQHEAVFQFDPLTLQILKRADACQSKTIGVIKILKVGIDSRGIHKFT
jgi:hypothetical protein